MTMKISAMGQEQTVKIASTTDTYYATDIKAELNPFASVSGGDMANMFGTTNKDFADQAEGRAGQAAQRALRCAPSAPALSSRRDRPRVTNSQAEVTSIQWVACRSQGVRGSRDLHRGAVARYGRASAGSTPPK